MQYLFLAAVFGILGSLPLVVFAAVRKKPLSLVARGLLIFLLLAPVPFLLFGFLASFEPGAHWGWRFWLWSILTMVYYCSWETLLGETQTIGRPSIDAHSLAAQQATNKAFDMK